jgi:hypothetical protein
MTTRRPTQPAPHDQASRQLAAVALGFTARRITSRSLPADPRVSPALRTCRSVRSS